MNSQNDCKAGGLRFRLLNVQKNQFLIFCIVAYVK